MRSLRPQMSASDARDRVPAATGCTNWAGSMWGRIGEKCGANANCRSRAVKILSRIANCLQEFVCVTTRYWSFSRLQCPCRTSSELDEMRRTLRLPAGDAIGRSYVRRSAQPERTNARRAKVVKKAERKFSQSSLTLRIATWPGVHPAEVQFVGFHVQFLRTARLPFIFHDAGLSAPRIKFFKNCRTTRG